MGTRRQSGVAYSADTSPFLYILTDMHENPRTMAIVGCIPVLMIDDDQVAVARDWACADYRSVRRSKDRSTFSRLHVDSRMECYFARERVDTHTERSTGYPPVGRYCEYLSFGIVGFHALRYYPRPGTGNEQDVAFSESIRERQTIEAPDFVDRDIV